jgi:signal transduction histidine kinase
LQLLENTLSAASLGTGKMRLQPSEFPLAQLVIELRESVGALPEAAKGVPVRWEVADILPVVRLDRLKVKEIVHNLTSNALVHRARRRLVTSAATANRCASTSGHRQWHPATPRRASSGCSSASD